MIFLPFIKRQVTQLYQGGTAVWARKIKRALRLFYGLPMLSLALLIVVVIRLIKPWVLVRLGPLVNSRIGHFAANTELYLCERDSLINVPRRRFIDILFMGHEKTCNHQLKTMWKRVLHIWPNWVVAPVYRINQLIPGAAAHQIGQNTQQERDVHDLLRSYAPRLKFTMEEEELGRLNLRRMGILQNSPFVCLNVRDSSYLDNYLPDDWSYHNYRDSNVQNYVLAAEELARRGYYVIRMGAKVHAAINSKHPKVIDYATNGMRSEFMDIYLGAKCTFCISSGTGWDSLPYIFRRPIVYVNVVPLAKLVSCENSITITKHFFKNRNNQELSLREILKNNVELLDATTDYESSDIRLLENTPAEIRDVVIEMDERLNKKWQAREEDEILQRTFWEIFPLNAVDIYNMRPLHGKARGRFGTNFLRNNKSWLQ